MRFDPLVLVGAVFAGGGIGFISGLFGIGGGFLLVPVLNIVLRIPIQFAVGSGVCQVLGPATTSLLARRVGRDSLKLPLTVAGGLFTGVFSGVHVFQLAERRGNIVLGGALVPLADVVVLSVYLLLLLGVGLFAVWDARRELAGRPIRRGWIVRWQIPPFGQFSQFDPPRVSIPILVWFGLTVGFLAGLLGTSGGLILIPGLIYLLGVKTHRAVVSSLLIVWMTAAQATLVHAWHGHVDLPLVAALLLGGTLGARLGAEFGLRLAGRQLRSAFGWMVLCAAVLIAARLVWLVTSGTTDV